MRADYLDKALELSDHELVSLIDDLPLWSAPFGQKLLDVVRIGKNLKVLDVGCGAGFPVVELAARLGESCQCFGIDPWAEALDRARQKAAAWRIQFLRFEQATAESLPFDDGYFDAIVSNNGLNNVQDDRKAMREIDRVAKPGAQLVITINLPDTFSVFYAALMTILIQANQRPKITRLFDHIFSKRKPLIYWRQMIMMHGFQIKEIYEHDFTFRYSDGAAMFNHFLIRTAFLPSWREIIGDDGIFTQVRNELDRRALITGELTMIVPWCCMVAVKSPM